MSYRQKGFLFGGGARRVVVEKNDEGDDEFLASISDGNRGPGESRESGESASPFQMNNTSEFSRLGKRTDSVAGTDTATPGTGIGVKRVTGGRSISRLVVPKTVERRRRKSHQMSPTGQVRRDSGLERQMLPVRRTSISQEYLPEAPEDLIATQGPLLGSSTSREPSVSSRLSLSLSAMRVETHPPSCARDQSPSSDHFLLAWLNSVLDPWGHGAPSTLSSDCDDANTRSVVSIYTHKDVLKDRMMRQWVAMGEARREMFDEPMSKISQRLAKNPLKVAKAMESVVRTAVVKHQVMAALGSYARVWVEVASDLLLSEEESLPLRLNLHLAAQEKEWLLGLVGRDAGKNARLQAFGKLCPDGYCRIALHVMAVVLLLDGIFSSTKWEIPVWAPPLFCGVHTSSHSVLQGSVGFFLDETADVLRWLQRSGYRVSYTQPIKKCVSFGVSNLAVDLRDGVVLCRLAELLVPGCERLKPLHPVTRASERMRNIELALSKLGMEDYVEARPIADGDKAATMGLLWNCVIRFELDGALNVNAISAELSRLGGGIVVQCAGLDVHDPYLRSLLDAESTLGRPPVTAASYVVRWACCLYNIATCGVIIDDAGSDHPLGGPSGRRRVLESFLAQYGGGPSTNGSIQARQRPGSFTKKVDFLLRPLGKDHGMPRIFSEEQLLYSTEPLDQRPLLVLYGILLKRVLSVHHEQRAAIVIQRCWRQYIVDKQAPEFAKKHLEMWIHAARIIQRNVRPFLARRRVEASRASRLLFVDQIIRIQAIWRQKTLRKQYLNMRGAAVLIQAHWRGFAARSVARARAQLAERQAAAALLIQSHWRSFAQTRVRKASVDACLRIQTIWRMVEQRRQFTEMRLAAVVVQKHVRGMLVERDLRARNSACLKIQATWRMARQRAEFLRMRSAAITIQSTWRMTVDSAIATKRLEAAVFIQRQWRLSRRLQLEEASELLQRATLDLEDALMEFASWALAELRVDKAERQRIDAARKIQSAWRERAIIQKTSQYLLDVHRRASAAVKLRTLAAKEEWAARTIQAAWRDRVMVERTSARLMKIFEDAKETVRLNERYGTSVVKIQTQVRGYLVRTQHPNAALFAAIRGQLRAATERAEVLRREGVDDPTTLFNMTRVAIDGLQGGSNLPNVQVLQHLERCLASSIPCCEHFIDRSGVQYLTSALMVISRDRLREDSMEQGLLCMETLAACGRFSDRVGGVLLENDGEDVKRLFQLLYQIKDSHEVFHALVGAFRAVAKGKSFCRAVASSHDLSSRLRQVHRAISLKQSQVASYLENLQGRRGSEISIANATRTLYRMEKQTAALSGLMNCLGIDCASGDADQIVAVSSLTPLKSRNTGLKSPLAKTGTRMVRSTKKGLSTPVVNMTKNRDNKANPTRRVLGNISNTICN